MRLFDLLNGDGQIGLEHFARDHDALSHLPSEGAAEAPKTTNLSAAQLQALREVQSTLRAAAASARGRSNTVDHADVVLPGLALAAEPSDEANVALPGLALLPYPADDIDGSGD
jgi:hypothetical protein